MKLKPRNSITCTFTAISFSVYFRLNPTNISVNRQLVNFMRVKRVEFLNKLTALFDCWAIQIMISLEAELNGAWRGGASLLNTSWSLHNEFYRKFHPCVLENRILSIQTCFHILKAHECKIIWWISSCLKAKWTSSYESGGELWTSFSRWFFFSFWYCTQLGLKWN